MTNPTKISRFLITASFVILAIGFHVQTAFAQSICDNFINTCNVPGSIMNYTISDSLLGTTGEVGEPRPSTDWADDENPYTTTWYHWTPALSGTIIVDTRGTNANAAPPNYEFPFVIDTLIAVYTGSTLTTLTRRAENDNWGFGGSCTNPRPLGESSRSSCMRLSITAGTTYHFQVDKFAEASPDNNNLLLNVTFFPPLAASVSICGRITDNNGNAIGKVRVSLTKPNGEILIANTNHFGYYTFEGVEVGQTYTLQANSKRFQFQNNPRIISVGEELQNENFIGF